MKKICVGLLLLASSFLLAGAQGLDRSKLVIGGSLGLQFGDYTLVNVSPEIGYRLCPYLTAGVGASYTYYKDKYRETKNSPSYDHSASYFGMSVFGHFYPYKYIVLSVQPEASRMWRTFESPGGKLRLEKFVPSVLVGAGISLGPVTAMIRYDVVQDANSPYSDNIFYSIGYTFGF